MSNAISPNFINFFKKAVFGGEIHSKILYHALSGANRAWFSVKSSVRTQQRQEKKTGIKSTHVGSKKIITHTVYRKTDFTVFRHRERIRKNEQSRRMYHQVPVLSVRKRKMHNMRGIYKEHVHGDEFSQSEKQTRTHKAQLQP